MDLSSNSFIDLPSSKVRGSKSSATATSSSTSNLVHFLSNQPVVDSPKVGAKRVIRTITPLDPKKLQQAGLDRKIAEALSKQKSQTKLLLNRTSTGPTNAQESPADTNFVTTKKIKLPKITITAPEVLTENEKLGLANLNSHQRLVHVKHLLNKKILEKKNTETDDNIKTSQHLKPPPSLRDNLNCKLATRPPNEKPPSTQKLFCVLKEPAEISTPPVSAVQQKTKLPLKSPQDVARKLLLQPDYRNKAADEGILFSIKPIKNDTIEIPKASIKAGQSQQYKSLPSNATQSYRQLQHGGAEAVPTKQLYTTISKYQGSQNCPTKNTKQSKGIYSNEIPKASIKTAQNQISCSSSSSFKQLKQNEQKIGFPEDSPPIANIQRKSNFSAIDSFKKPYPTLNPTYCDLQHKSRAPNLANDAAAKSSDTNCLIVLENKVLTQDEMIDLTELRLSNSTPNQGFINPHKPIPEVVIKVENTDEYPVTDFPTPSLSLQKPPEVANVVREIQTQNMTKDRRVVISNKQNKIILSAQKLKVPPEQLVALAKKIRLTSSAPLPAASTEKNHHNVQYIHLVNTKAANKNTPNKHAAYTVLPNTLDTIAKVPNQIPEKIIIQNKPLHTDFNKRDQHDFQSNFIKSLNSTPIENNEHLYLMPYFSDKSNKIVLDNSNIDANSLEMADNSSSSIDCNKSAVEILDGPFHADDCFSAVDFITAFSNTNPTTEETSLELSPEELNLNASCALNLSPLRIKSFPPSKATTHVYQKTSSPTVKTNLNDNLLNSREVGTIVIESSKGPQTVLTSASSPEKCVKTLQTLKDFHKTVFRKMEVKKTSVTLSNTSESNVKQPELNEGKKLPTFIMNKSILKKFDKFHDSQQFEKSSENLTINSTNNDNKISTDSSLDNNSTGNIILEPLKEPKHIDLTNVKVTNDPKQISLIISSLNPNENYNKFLMSSTSTRSVDLLKTVTSESDSPQKFPVTSTTVNPSYSEDLLKTITFKNDSPQKSSVTSPTKAKCSKLSENKTEIDNKEPKLVETHQHNILPAKIVEEEPIRKICSDFKNLSDTGISSEQLTQNDITSKTKNDTPQKCFIISPIKDKCSKLTENITEIINKDSQNIIAAKKVETNQQNLPDTTGSSSEKSPQNDIASKASLQSSNKDVERNPESVKDDNVIVIAKTSCDINLQTTNNYFQATSESSKTKEITSKTTAVASKRISRFKKGKINLIQRNKTGQVPNKPLSADKQNEVIKSFDQTFNRDEKVDSETEVAETNDVALTTKENRGESSNKSLIFKPKTRTKENPKEDEEDKSFKHTELPTTSTYNVKEIQDLTETAAIQQTIHVTNEIFSQESRPDVPKESINAGINSFQELSKLLQKTNVDIDIPKASIKTSHGIQQYSHEKEISDNNLGMPKASIRKGNQSQRDSESNGKRISDYENSIPKTSIRNDDSLKQQINSQEKRVSDNKGILKASIRTGSQEKGITDNDKSIPKASITAIDNSQQYSEAQVKKIIDNNKDMPKISITADNLQEHSKSKQKELTDNNKSVLKTSINTSDSSQQLSSSHEQNITNSLISDIIENHKASTNINRSLQQQTVNMDIPKSSVNIGNLQKHSNLQEKTLLRQGESSTKSLISQNMGIPKESVEISNKSQTLSSPEKICSLEETPKTVTVEQIELQKNIFEKTFPAANSLNKFDTSEPPETQTSQTVETKAVNLVQGSKMNISSNTQNLNQESEAILKAMKGAKVFLVDVVKHSPIKATETSPCVPFKKICREIIEPTPEAKGIKTLLKQLKTNTKEKEAEQQNYKLEQSKQPEKNVLSNEVVEKDEENLPGNKRSSRPSSRTSKSQTATPSPTAPTKKRKYSTRLLISDDDLEFLPENAEIKFKLSKAKPNEKDKECSIETTPLTSAAHKRQHRLYSKPLELELSSLSQQTKRTRYYSQTLEANVTLTFDTLNSKANSPVKICKPLKLEASCFDSNQDSNKTTPTKQRKKLRKTTEDIKKSQKTHGDTDSDDDDDRCYDRVMKDCEESNEFLGFEEISEGSSFHNTQQQDAKETQHDVKTKHGILKNWLTTGKAISPTIYKMANTQQRRDKQMPASSCVKMNTKEMQRLQKNFPLTNNTNEETDITDDTSPVDDEEESGDKFPISKKCKKDVENVIDVRKDLMENKNDKLDNLVEHSFTKPRNLNGDENFGKFQKPQPTKHTDFEHSREMETNSKKGANKSKKVIESFSKKTSQKKSKCTATDLHFRDKKETEQLTIKHKTKNVKKAKNTDTNIDKAVSSKIVFADSDIQEEKGLKRLKSKCKTEEKISDTSIKYLSLKGHYSKRKEDSHSKTKQKSKDKLNSTQEHRKPDNSKNRRDKSIGSTEQFNANTNNFETEIEVKHNEATEISCSTSQNLTIKKKRGRPKTKPIETESDPIIKMNKSKIKEVPSDNTVSSNSKKAIISKTSEDEQKDALPFSTGKHSLKRKLKIYDSDSDFISTPLSKSQDSESSTNTLKPISTPSLGLLKDEAATSSVCKKRKSNTECNFNPRLLLITKREQLDTDEIITETTSGSGAIQCGLCLRRTKATKWKLHLSEHYGIGWQVGEEKLHIENRTVVLNNMLNYMKDTASKELICRMCKKGYRSALGLLMHIEACGAKAVRIVCEFCKKDYAKASYPIHMRSCYARIAFENETSGETMDESNEKKEEIFGNSGRLKRNSTIKAENRLKALGEELEKGAADNETAEKSDIDPKSRIRYVPPLQEDFTAKWSDDIKNLGQSSCPKVRCKFTSSDINELSEHLKNCKHNKSGFFCNFCRRLSFKTEKLAIEHVIKSHKNGRSRKKSDDSDCNLKTDDEESSDYNDLTEGDDETESVENTNDEDDDLDDICSNRKGSKKQKMKKPYSRIINQSTGQTSRKEVFDGRYTDLNKAVLEKWTNFLKLNYSCEPLFAEFTPQYSAINSHDFYKYLPTQEVSMKFNLSTKKTLSATVGVPEQNIEWSELKRYESINHEMNTYFFLGAPVKLCSWLPLPANVNEQYLAVVYRQEMFKYVKFSQPKQHHSIVLIIKVTENKKSPQLNVHYGFIIPDGPIHNLSFLPSGGYDKSSNRLALVAVATISSVINIYSLPLNVDLTATQENFSINENITLIDVQPSFSLNLDILQEKEAQHVLLNPQCLQICWSETTGHQYIFAGFSNGFLGIWDITNDTQQNLNRFVVDKIIKYAALNYFYIGEKSAKRFAVHYDSSGPRWLAVSGAYRKFVIYDIRHFMQPVIMKDEVNKSILLSMDWCPLWETVLYSYCDMIPNSGRCVMALNPTNIIFGQNKLDIMSCGVTQVHYTPFANMCVAATSNGDILLLDTKELHYECILNKKFGERRMLYTIDIKQLNGEPLVRFPKANQATDVTKVPSDFQMYDLKYKEKYGLIFKTLINLKENDRKNYLSEDRCPPVNLMPFMRINTLRCNLNYNGKNLIALGYENGFIRLVYFKKETMFCN